MKRVIIAGTIAFLAAITVGLALTHDVLLEAVAANNTASQIIRVVVIGLLLALLFTSPPRSAYFRIALGFASAILTIGVAVLLSQYEMPALDSLLFVEVAIIFAMEALESGAAITNPAKKIAVVYHRQNEKIKI